MSKIVIVVFVSDILREVVEQARAAFGSFPDVHFIGRPLLDAKSGNHTSKADQDLMQGLFPPGTRVFHDGDWRMSHLTWAGGGFSLPQEFPCSQADHHVVVLNGADPWHMVPVINKLAANTCAKQILKFQSKEGTGEVTWKKLEFVLLLH